MKALFEVQLEGDCLVASLRRRTEVKWSAGCRVSDPEDLHAALAELLALEPVQRARPRVRVLFGAPTAQCRRLLDLPVVNARDLALLVARKPGRYFRKNGIPLITSVQRCGAPSRQSPGQAVAAAVEEPWMTAVESALAPFRMIRYSVHPLGAPELTFESADARQRRYLRERRLLLRLAAGCVLVWIVAGCVTLIRRESDLAWLKEEQLRLDRPAQAILEVQRRLHGAERAIYTVHRDAAGRRTALLALVSVLSALPDSAYLRQFQWSDGAGSLAGTGTDAARILEAVEADGALPRPRLEGLVSRDSTAGRIWETFTIAFGDTAR